MVRFAWVSITGFFVSAVAVLMLLLFAGGVMNLWVIVGLTAFVVFEKVASIARYGARITGALMVAGGLWMRVR